MDSCRTLLAVNSGEANQFASFWPSRERLHESIATREPLEVRVVAGESRCVVAVIGELDIATVPALDRVLDQVGAGGRMIDVDLAHLTFVDLAGWRRLRALERGANERKFRIVNRPSCLERLEQLLDRCCASAGGSC